jgi:hypothetical protein
MERTKKNVALLAGCQAMLNHATPPFLAVIRAAIAWLALRRRSAVAA